MDVKENNFCVYNNFVMDYAWEFEVCMYVHGEKENRSILLIFMLGDFYSNSLITIILYMQIRTMYNASIISLFCHWINTLKNESVS